MPPPRSHYVLSFVLKIWSEPTDKQNEPIDWRGDISHVGTGHVTYFDGLERLPKAIERLIELSEN